MTFSSAKNIELIQTPSYNIALGVMTLCVVAFYFGTLFRKKMPEHLLSDDTILTLRFATWPLLIVTSIAMFMVVMTVRESFNYKQQQIVEIANNVVSVDRALIHIGTPGTMALRVRWQEYVANITDFKNHTVSLAVDLNNWASLIKDFQELKVDPKKQWQVDTIPFVKRHMTTVIDSIGRLNMDSQYLVYPFTMIMLTSWLCLIFNIIGFTSPIDNAATFWTICVIALAVGSIFFLIVEYESPHVGLVNLDMTPMRLAMEKMKDDYAQMMNSHWQ